jgi:transposase
MSTPLRIQTERIDDIVVLLKTMMQMQLPQLLNDHLPRHWKQQGLDWGWVIVIWLAYIVSQGDHRKVVVREWVEQRRQMLEEVCGIEIRATDFSDDRLSIVLRQLSEEERWLRVEKELNQRTVRIYHLTPEVVRLDATTLSGNHMVNDAGLFQFGHSKDDPSLAQVKLMMASLDPLGMPIATQVVSGEQADDGLYIPAFEQSQISLGKEDLLWVGDCKMGAMATRSYMHHHHQFYLVPLARTGQVPELLAQGIREMQSQAATLHRVTPLRYDGSEGGSLSGYVTQRGVEGQTPEGYPVCWQEHVFLVHSLTHEQQQQQGLEQRLKTAEKKLLKLTPPVGRGRKQITTEAELVQKATAILKAQHVDGLLTYEFVFEPQTKTHQARYQIIQVNRQEAAIEQSQQTFGWRMYVSNTLAGRLSFEEAVLTYRNEWILEHGFHRFKGKSLGAHPVFVKRDDQVKGLLHLLSLGLRLLTLIEYVVHRQLGQTHDSLQGLYPEHPQKSTTRPSTERLLKAFENITLTFIEMDGQLHRHLTPLTPLQEKILQLLGFSPQIYTDLQEKSGY